MKDRIDYTFLSSLEGGSKTTGYVPAPAVSRSGITIATGFDLGQRNEADLRRLNLSSPLIKQLKPYLAIKGLADQSLLTKQPLIISAADARAIDLAVKAEHVRILRQHYDTATAGSLFHELPTEAQTVIASVSFQYGPRLSVRAPKFWAAVIAEEWAAAILTLRKFGDAYPTRRNREADLLERLTVQGTVGGRAGQGVPVPSRPRVQP